MRQRIDAIYENGVFKPIRPDSLKISEGQKVSITIEDEIKPEAIKLATSVYDGLSDNEIDEVEQIAMDRSHYNKYI